MEDYRQAFLDFVVAHGILQFGQFTLKSGRVSPYFFNAGLFDTGSKLHFLSRCYAAAIAAGDHDFDLLFGPAYKGIPLVAGIAMVLAAEYGIDLPYCFNRKEVKDHGEGGAVVGAELQGRVLVVDDVITAGTAVGEAVDLIHRNGGSLASIAIALDRQEKGTGGGSAIGQIEETCGVRVISITTLQHIVDYLERSDDVALQSSLAAMHQYRETYGAG